MKIKAIGANVFKTERYSDCSNSGISSRYDEILIECEDGYITLDTDDLPENFCEIKTREVFGKQYTRLVPHYLVNSGKWSMMGGNFAYSSDSRFPFDYPLPIHDRVEN